MENSYRFIMIAATFLLGIMLFSILVYVFNAGARSNRAIDEAQIEQQLIADNAKFEYYNKANNTTSEMISLINLVNDYNLDRYEDDCIKLIIYIGNGTSTYLKIDGNTENLGRNNVFLNTGEKISVYQLASENAADGGLFYGKNTILSGSAEDNFSLTKYDSISGTTFYKYLFSPVDPTSHKLMFKYDDKSGRVSEMTFYVSINDTNGAIVWN